MIPSLLIALACNGPDDIPRDTDKPTDPLPPAPQEAPVVEGMVIEMADATRGRLLVRFAEGHEPTKADLGPDDRGWPVELDDGTRAVVIDGGTADRARGDRIWSADIPFDAPAFALRLDAWRRRVEKRGDGASLGVFEDRARVASAPIRVQVVSPGEVLRGARSAEDALTATRVISADAFGAAATIRIPAPDTAADTWKGAILPLDVGLGALLDKRRIPKAVFGLAGTSDPARTLLVTDTTVLTDPTRTNDLCSGGNPDGKWTFKHAVEGIANGHDARVWTESWMNAWAADQTVNGQVIPGADSTRQQAILARWVADSGAGAGLDLAKAPFRLIAVVNRIDLADGGYGGGGEAGEGRLVFTLVDNTTGGCEPLDNVVIFEYGLPFASCPANRTWAQAWLALDALTPGTEAYAAALEALTEQFVGANAAPSKVNKSALNQIRTNDFVFRTSGQWELREFHLATSGQLAQTTIANTPANGLEHSAAVDTFIASGATTFPDTFQGAPFLGAWAAYNPSDFWGKQTSQTYTAAERHAFSLNTCDGCHAGETNTFFLHLDPTPTPGNGGLAVPSNFLTGASPSNVPANCTTNSPGCLTVQFDDLDRRAQDLDDRATLPCLVRPIQFASAIGSRFPH